MRIEPFQLERWMTKYEMVVKWDIAESGIYPMTIDKDGVLMTRNFDKESFELIDQIIENQGDIMVNQIPQALTTVISQRPPAQPKGVPQQPPQK